MIKLTINNTEIEVKEGTTVLDAAEQIGAKIPTMCFKEGYENCPSCMICVVKDVKTSQLFPSCAMKAAEGMNLLTDDPEIIKARKEALELLISDHVGDCEAPCRIACPAYMNIPLMNRLIAKGKFKEAVMVVKEEIALPLILGNVCSAPCEKVCRRNQADEAVSICLLKKFVADEDFTDGELYIPEKKEKTGKKTAVIGAGSAGLACAFHLLKSGHECTVFDKNKNAGGDLSVSIKEGKLLQKDIDDELKILNNLGLELKLNTFINKAVFENTLLKDYDAIVIACGKVKDVDFDNFGLKYDKNGITVNKKTYQTEQENIFACGSAVKHQKMAVRALAQGKAAAYSVDSYLMKGEIETISRKFNSKFGKLQEGEVSEYMKEASDISRIQPQDDKYNSFNPEEAKKEASRCMHCDCRKPDTCKLRIYCAEYKIDRRAFALSERKELRKYFNHDVVVYEPQKCIRCGLCIEITTKNNEEIGFTSIGRGFDVVIDIPFSKSLNEALEKTAEECVNSCPTGALSFK